MINQHLTLGTVPQETIDLAGQIGYNIYESIRDSVEDAFKAYNDMVNTKLEIISNDHDTLQEQHESLEEADKYVGFPYVWGGSTPETSFDCSGFVSYVLTNSGLYNTGRLGAQGLYNISTRVSNPQPGDLVFFTGTYDTPGVSHVGIYVGEDGDGSPVMLHCGDPIQYAKLDTSYWQSHFYAYGRLHYN